MTEGEYTPDRRSAEPKREPESKEGRTEEVDIVSDLYDGRAGTRVGKRSKGLTRRREKARFRRSCYTVDRVRAGERHKRNEGTCGYHGATVADPEPAESQRSIHCAMTACQVTCTCVRGETTTSTDAAWIAS